MKWHTTTFLAAGILASAAALAPAAPKDAHKKPATRAPAAPAPVPGPNYQVANELKIGGAGPWISATLDAAGKFLYIPRGKHTQVVDTATGKVVDIPGESATCIALVPDVNRGFITNFQQGTVTVFDLKTNAVLGNVAIGPTPHGIIYDPASKRLLVHCGASTLVPFSPDIDVKAGKPEPAITFDGEIHGFVADDQGMVYVTLGDKNQVAVLDTRSMNVATHWPVGAWQTPSAISMDRIHSRLFVCCRSAVKILSASDGHILGEVNVAPADIWKYGPLTTTYYDGHIFATCGDGDMAIVGQQPDGDFTLEEKMKVEPHSEPIAIDKNNGKIYLPTEQVDNRKPVPGTFKILVLQKK